VLYYYKSLMKTIKNLERLQQLHHLIVQECTGSPSILAQHMQISVRLVHSLLEQLKDFGAPIRYNRSRKTYYYHCHFELAIHVSIRVGTTETQTDMMKGSYFAPIPQKPQILYEPHKNPLNYDLHPQNNCPNCYRQITVGTERRELFARHQVA